VLKRKPAKNKAEPASDAAEAAEAASQPAPAPEKRVRQRLRCSSCGFVQSGTNAGKTCHACGAEALQAYEEELDPKRVRMLGLRLHPMASHAAPAFAATLLGLAAAMAAVGEDPLRSVFLDTARVLSVLLPAAIAIAALTGLVDAKLRLKSRTTRFLVQKIVASALFFALSFAAAAWALFTDLSDATLIPYSILMTLCSVAAIYLGRKGSALRNALVKD